jgi:hypothetical protein
MNFQIFICHFIVEGGQYPWGYPDALVGICDENVTKPEWNDSRRYVVTFHWKNGNRSESLWSSIFNLTEVLRRDSTNSNQSLSFPLSVRLNFAIITINIATFHESNPFSTIAILKRTRWGKCLLSRNGDLTITLEICFNSSHGVVKSRYSLKSMI